MNIRQKSIILSLLVIALMAGGSLILHASHDRHDSEHAEKAGHGNRADDHARPGQTMPNRNGLANQEYSAACGSCHMAYPPQLLPAASWREIVNGDHFGVTLPLAEEQRDKILTWLEQNDVQSGSGKLAKKARKHLRGQQVGRITEIAYLQRKHRKIDDAVFKRPSIGSFSNCKACHPGAEQGRFRGRPRPHPRPMNPLDQ